MLYREWVDDVIDGQVRWCTLCTRLKFTTSALQLKLGSSDAQENHSSGREPANNYQGSMLNVNVFCECLKHLCRQIYGKPSKNGNRPVHEIVVSKATSLSGSGCRPWAEFLIFSPHSHRARVL